MVVFHVHLYLPQTTLEGWGWDPRMGLAPAHVEVLDEGVAEVRRDGRDGLAGVDDEVFVANLYFF